MAARRPSPLALPARGLLAVGAALALADASVVTLALPEILDRLHTTIEGLAAVIGVYTVVLAVAVLAAIPVRRWLGTRTLGAVGMLLFAVASVACGVSDTMEGLLVARGAQAVGAAAGLVATHALIGRVPGGRPSRSWVAAAVFGTAIGPALGGALTEAFDWRAIFLAQAPFGVLAAVAALVRQPAVDEAEGAAARATSGPSNPGPGAPAAGDQDAQWGGPTPEPGLRPRSTNRPAAADAPTRVLRPGDDETLVDALPPRPAWRRTASVPGSRWRSSPPR
jgi:MFS family permease